MSRNLPSVAVAASAAARTADARRVASHWLATPPLRFRTFWLLSGALALALVLLVCTARTPAPLHGLMPNDKLLHVLGYAGLTALFAQILLDRRGRLAVVVLLVAFGALVECVQGLGVTRRFELLRSARQRRRRADRVADRRHARG